MKCSSYFLLLIFIFSISAWARKPIEAMQYEQLSGIRNIKDTKIQWDKRFSTPHYVFGKLPAKFLVENYMTVTSGGTVLDMGMSEGRNAVFMAKKGFEVTGIDISSVAVKKARLLAKEQGVNIKTIVASLNDYKFPEKSFDAILDFYYVDRTLVSKMMKWLKPGGLIFFEAHTIKQKQLLGRNSGKDSYYLEEQELLTMFPGFKIIKYDEPFDAETFKASAILQKPLSVSTH